MFKPAVKRIDRCLLYRFVRFDKIQPDMVVIGLAEIKGDACKLRLVIVRNHLRHPCRDKLTKYSRPTITLVDVATPI